MVSQVETWWSGWLNFQSGKLSYDGKLSRINGHRFEVLCRTLDPRRKIFFTVFFFLVSAYSGSAYSSARKKSILKI